MRSDRWRWTRAFLGSVLIGLLTSIPVAGSGDLLLRAQAHASRYTYCSINDYYETWQSNVSNQNGGITVNEEMHYRVNSNCTWKAYWQSYTPVGGGGGGAIPQYEDGATFYEGVPGNPTLFDYATGSCTNGNATDYFGQTSASAALIETQTQWWTTSSCTYGTPVTDTHFPYNQP